MQSNPPTAARASHTPAGPAGPGGQHRGRPAFDAPESAEEAVIGLLMQAGRRLRTRHPDDEVDPSSFPLAKRLLCGDAMRVSDLATQVELDTSTVSRQVKQLEHKGILERTTDPDDGRASLVRLSDRGRATMEAAFRRRRDRIRAALEPWSERDRDQLQKLLTRLAADLREANDRDAHGVDTSSEGGAR